MSNKIDKFIHALFKTQGDELIFTTGRPVRIRSGDDEKVVLDQEVRTDQVDKLVSAVLAEDDLSRFSAQGENQFFYEAPDGMVRIVSRRKGAQVMVTIAPSDGAEEETPPPLPLPLPLTPAEPAEDGEAIPGFDSGRFGDTSARAPIPQIKSSLPKVAPVNIPVALEPDTVSPENGSPRPVPSKPPSRASVAPSGPASGAIDRILTQMAKMGASDLHLSADHRPKVRKDGDVQDLPGWNEPLAGETIQEWMFEVAAKRIREQFLETNDADYSHEVPGVARFRMNLFKDRRGTGAVIRTIPSKVLTAEELGLPPVVKTFCNFPKGLVLVTGPTGSGKSTTLAAMIDLVNKSRSDHIITIEDPVEFVHQSQKCLVNQREVHTHTESFARALRAALREDPDIVLVGEMRDLETVHIAIETAETGHLVFGTLHTNTAPSTVDRIIDQFPTDRQAQIRVMLSESLRGVISQTLCKKVGGGRVACLEILVVNNAVSNLIREGKTFQIPSMMQTGKAQGMQTQIDAMMELVKSGKVAPLEAYTKAVDQGLMKGALERAGIRLDVK